MAQLDVVSRYVASVERRDREVEDAPARGFLALAYVVAGATVFDVFGLASIHPLLTTALIFGGVALAHIEAEGLRQALWAAKAAGVERCCAILAANPITTIPVRPPRGYFVDDEWHYK